MAALQIQAFSDISAVFFFSGESPIVIGSDYCDILLSKDQVSPQHAQIYQDMESIVIEDCHGSTGVFVDGKKVFMHTLKEGNQIRLGECQITFSYQNYESLLPAIMKKKLWPQVEKIWSLSDNICIIGRGAGGNIDPGCGVFHQIIENRTDFPDEDLYCGVLSSSKIVAGYSLLVLLYRKSPILQKKPHEWQRARAGSITYAKGCSIYGLSWSEFVQESTNDIAPSLQKYSGQIQKYANKKDNPMFLKMLDGLQEKAPSLWRKLLLAEEKELLHNEIKANAQIVVALQKLFGEWFTLDTLFIEIQEDIS